MRLIRSVYGTLALAAFTGCIADPGPTGTNGGSTGSFSVTVTQFANGPTNGNATFSLDEDAGTSVLTISMRDKTGISLTLTGPGAPVAGDERDIGEEEGRMAGVLVRQSGIAAGTYVLSSGRIVFDGVSATRLVGQIEFTAVQTQGAAVGSTVSGVGNFNASGGNATP